MKRQAVSMAWCVRTCVLEYVYYDSIHVLVQALGRVQWQMLDRKLHAGKERSMTFQAPITIKERLQNIRGRQYAMPARSSASSFGVPRRLREGYAYGVTRVVHVVP